MAASALGVPQVWDSTPYGNSTPATDPSLRFNAIDHYFNMNPQDYGLTYEIFVEDEAFTFTSTVGYAPTAALAVRQAETSVPGTCYPWCNDCLLEGMESLNLSLLDSRALGLLSASPKYRSGSTMLTTCNSTICWEDTRPLRAGLKL